MSLGSTAVSTSLDFNLLSYSAISYKLYWLSFLSEAPSSVLYQAKLHYFFYTGKLRYFSMHLSYTTLSTPS